MTKPQLPIFVQATNEKTSSICDNSRVAPSSRDPPDTLRFTEVIQLLGQKHVFLMAKAKLPIAICTLGKIKCLHRVTWRVYAQDFSISPEFSWLSHGPGYRRDDADIPAKETDIHR